MQTNAMDFSWPLSDGERIIWSGHPRQGLVLTGRDWFLVPFSLLWGGFAIYWEAGVALSGAPLMFRIFGVPFVLMGLYLVVGRFIVDAWLRQNTYYAVTNRRILIVRVGVGSNLTAIGLDRLPDVQLSRKPDGHGTLRFGQSTFLGWGRGGFGMWTPSLDPTPQFIGILDAQGVFDKIQRAIQSGASLK